MGKYEDNLDRNPANHQPLTPLTFLERAAKTFPDHVAVIHGNQRLSYREFWQRSLKLASALAAKGIGKGDTVTVMLSNTPPMLEAHFGVPMTKAVLHSLNTRLDAAVIAFQLDHAETKVLIVDREFSGVVRQALALAKVKPLVIDYDDLEYADDAPYPKGERIGTLDYEDFVASGDAGLRLVDARRRMGRDRAQLHLGHHRQPEGRGLPPSRRRADGLQQHHPRRHGQAPRLSVDAADVPLQRLVLPLDAGDAGGHPCLPALGARQADLRRHRRPRRHPSVRRADRHVDC